MDFVVFSIDGYFFFVVSHSMSGSISILSYVK